MLPWFLLGVAVVATIFTAVGVYRGDDWDNLPIYSGFLAAFAALLAASMFVTGITDLA